MQLSIQIECCGLWSQTLSVFETNIEIKDIFLTISLRMLALKSTTIVLTTALVKVLVILRGPPKSVKITWYSMSTCGFYSMFLCLDQSKFRLWDNFVWDSIKIFHFTKHYFFWPSIKKFVAFETKYLSVFETIFMLPST